MTGSFMADKVLFCKVPTIGKKLPFFPNKVQGLNRQPQGWEASVLPLHHHGSFNLSKVLCVLPYKVIELSIFLCILQNW